MATASEIPIREHQPFWFTIAKLLARKRIRGAYRFWQFAESRGWPRYWGRYALSPKMAILVPVYREENRWDQQDIDEYERPLIQDLVRQIEKIGRDTVVFDCGAEIGIFSLKVLAGSSFVTRLIAFEPNPEPYRALAENYSNAPVPATAHQKGVADRQGRGTLQMPDYDDLEYSQYVDIKEEGDFEVTTIDALGIRNAPMVVLKADVEGAEEQVLHGARETLKSATDFIAIIEAHPAVVSRTNCDPNRILRWLLEQRPCYFRVAEAPDVKIALDQPFFALFPNQTRTFNIIVSSRPLT
jgi:FkbM family methyltransferase